MRPSHPVRLQRGLLASLALLAACAAGPQTPGRPPTVTAFSPPTAAPVTDSPTVAPVPTPATEPPAAASGAYYDPGAFTVQDVYVSPTGNDANSGASPEAPLQTLTAAWERLPAMLTSTGYRINLLPGVYPCEPLPETADNCINYFAGRTGAAATPIIIRGLDGPVTVRGGLNFSGVSYLYLYDLTLAGGGSLPTNSSGNNLLHLEQGDHVLLHGLTLAGPDCATDACNNLQEALKVNQTQHLYVEDSAIGGAWHSAVDYFVVQHGHFLNNAVHTAGQWCMYVKGGSAYLTVQGNEFHHCQLGFQSGQSANLAVMRSPWLHYETYDLKVVNNVFHHIPGVGLSAAGAYNTLFAYNTLYRVGTDTAAGYGLAQFVHGERNCTPIDEIPNVTDNCPAYTALGAWGPISVVDSLPAIPNRNVFVYNNLFYNPAPERTLYFQFGVNGPLARPAGFVNSPDPAQTDDNLQVRGNVIWNGAEAGLPFWGSTGGGPVGCEAGSACAEAAVLAENTVNQFEPQLVDPEQGDFRPAAGNAVLTTPAAAVPAFTWEAFTPAAPAGNLDNAVAVDRAGQPRPQAGPPGAYVNGAAAVTGHAYLAVVLRGR